MVTQPEETDAEFEASIKKMLSSMKVLPKSEVDRLNAEQEAKDAQRAKWRSWAKKNLPFRNAVQTLSEDQGFFSRLYCLQTLLGTGMTVAIIGKQGHGKTQLGVELLRNTPGYFTNGVEVGSYLRAFDTAEERMERLVSYPLLVIDEAFKKQESEWMSSLFFCLLNKRHEAMKDTILIDSITEAELAKACGASVISRIKQSGGIVECNWKNYREEYKSPQNLAEELAGYEEARRSIK